jgi:tripartite-type tricarboxylate transporter receptor subunit TctC
MPARLMPARLMFARLMSARLWLPVLFALIALGVAARADDFPSRPVTLVVSFAPGGLTDIPARVIAPAMQQALGQSVIVENRAGASGITGGSYVVRSNPDGYTLLVSALSEVQNYYYMSVPYDALTDLAPVGKIADGPPIVLIVGVNSPFKSVADLVAYAKANPAKMNFSTSGSGTTPAIALAQLNALAGTDIAGVPYTGTGPATQAVVSGDVQGAFVFYPSAKGMIDGGQLRVLAVASPNRMALMPDVPTMQELGYAGFTHYAFIGLSVPKGTPAAAVAVLNKALNEALATPAVKQRLEPLGMTIPPAPNSPDAYLAHMTKEAAHQADLAKLAGGKVPPSH